MMPAPIRLRLIALVAGFCLCPWSSGLAENLEPNVTAYVSADGSIELEGVRYTDADSLKAKISEIEARKPKPDIHINAPKKVRFEAVGKVILMLQKAGAPMKMGFITEPRSQ